MVISVKAKPFLYAKKQKQKEKREAEARLKPTSETTDVSGAVPSRERRRYLRVPYLIAVNEQAIRIKESIIDGKRYIH